MNCPHCQTPMPDDAVFCPNCGKRPGAAAAASGVRTFSGLSTVAPIREQRASVLEPGTRFAERYDIVRQLGEGGMGIVYVAKDTHTGEEMVLKLIHPDLVAGDDAVKRLMAEGLTARHIRHPNIVAVYDVSQWQGQAYFTMEFVKGGTLRSWLVNGISSGIEVKLDTAAGIVKSMLAGLAEAHRMGVIHRDLKPENVLLAGEPNDGNFDLKILDFGIAKAVGSRTTRAGGGAIGTPLYMAPEQMTSAEAVGPAADLYSLSVMFYELLMESLPQGRWEAVSKSRPDVPKAIDELIEKGLSSRPRSRFQTAAEYESALDKALGVRPKPQPGPVPPEPPGPTPDPKPPVPPNPIWQWQGWASMSKRTRMWVLGIGAFILIGVIGNMMDTGGDEYIDEPVPTSPGPPAAGGFNMSGYWMDQYGNRYDVTHDGSNFTARCASVGGYGAVTITGTLTPNGASFTLRAARGDVLQGNGQIYADGGGLPHLRFMLADGTGGDFKINHTN